MKIYNLSGQEIATLVHGFQTAGRKTIVWEPPDQKGEERMSGLYLCHLRAGSFAENMKMILIK